MNGLHGIIFSYEQEPGLRELAERRMPASIPFGGRYRVVDFMLSNLHAAGITDVGVVLHGNYQSLLDHIGNGKTWDMARKYGGLRILPPFADTRAYRSGEFRGKMEALAGVRSYLQGIRQDYVVLSDSDLIINLPLADVFAAHLESGADITAVCTANGGFVDNATYLTLESDGAIGQVWCAPTTPRGHRSLEIYILSKQLLLTLVDECSAQDKYSFRRDVLAGMTGRLKLQSYVWDGYAAQLRSVQEYYDRSMELLQGSIRAELFAAAAHPRQGGRRGVELFRAGQPREKFARRRRLHHRGQRGELHPLPRRDGGKGRGAARFHSLQGHARARRRDAPLRHHRQICGGPARAHAHGA